MRLRDGDVVSREPDMFEGEVLWIDSDLYPAARCPGGMPFQVLSFAGKHPDGRVYVRGWALSPRTRMRIAETVVLVPLSQPRAVLVPETTEPVLVRPFVAYNAVTG